MNSFRLRIVTGSLLLILISTSCLAKVYVYEVSTESRRFQTVSKLNPKAYLLYNGGNDTIKDLRVVAVYADNKLKDAMRDYKLEENNASVLLPKNYSNRNMPKPFVWWK